MKTVLIIKLHKKSNKVSIKSTKNFRKTVIGNRILFWEKINEKAHLGWAISALQS